MSIISVRTDRHKVKVESEHLSELAWDSLIDAVGDSWPDGWDPLCDGMRWTTVEPAVPDEHKPEPHPYEPSPADKAAAVTLFLDIDEFALDAWISSREGSPEYRQDSASYGDCPLW